jgi:outer membrane protein insertion porin family
MKFFPVRSLYVSFAVVTLLSCGNLSLGQTPATPCPGPSSTKLKTSKNLAGQQAAKPSAEEQKVRIEFLGLSAIPYCDALRALQNEPDPVTTKKMPDAKTTERASAVLKMQLESKGYLRAHVEAVRDEEVRLVLFVVNQGERLSLAEVKFEGNRVFTTDELSQIYKGCLTRFSSDGFNGEIHDYCGRVLESELRSRGYLQARAQAENLISAQGVVRKLRVDEGVLYRVGQIKIDGNEALTSDQVRSRLDLREGEVANGEKLGKWLFEDLKNVYGDNGFIEYTAEIVPTFKNDGVVDFEVVIDEGHRFTLKSIEFDGYTAKTGNPHDLFVLREGNVYNESLFRESIKRLNESGSFEWIDRDKDVDYLTDAEEHTLKLVVKVRSKN